MRPIFETLHEWGRELLSKIFFKSPPLKPVKVKVLTREEEQRLRKRR